KGLGIEIDGPRADAVERRVQHADDVRRLVRHHAPALLVVEHGYRDSTGVVGVALRVDLPQRIAAEARVGALLRAIVEYPALIGPARQRERDRDVLLEPFELAEDQRAMRPRAAERDVQVVAAGLRLEAAFARRPRCAVRRHPAADDGWAALEASVAEPQGRRLLIGNPAAVDHRSHST